MSTKKQIKLFQEFPPVTTKEWEEVINIDLKGADYDKKLVWKTLDNFKVQPYYRDENLEEISFLEGQPNEFPYVRGVNYDNDWLIRQDVVVDDCKKANEKAKNAISRGAQSIGFIKFGENDFKVKDLIDGIDLNAVEINFICGGKDLILKVVKDFTEIVKEKGFNPEKVSGSIDADPIKTLLLKGNCCESETVCFDMLKELILQTKHLPEFQVIGIAGSLLKNSGASITQELGFSLSYAVEYLNQLTDRGLKIDEIAPKIRFNFGVTASYFPEITKFRAARLLWSNILKSYHIGKDCGKIFIHAATSFINNTLYDPYVNMLRTTTESMSATLGGVHSLTVNPFNAAYEMTTEFSDRIARNQQIILKEESHLNKVADITAGSYFIENLTNSISEEAWKLFLETEEKGGFLTAIKEGSVQTAIETMAEKRCKNLNTRREILLGTNQFPNFTEQIKTEICECALNPCDCSVKGATIHTLKPFRLANDFEKLRLTTDKKEKRPTAFMLTIGNLAMRKARAQFSCNFFACAGYNVVDNNGFDTIEAGIKTAQEQKAEIVVLCSSDDEYLTYAPETFKAINGKMVFVVAGKPACIDELKATGIQHFIHVQSNLLETLKDFNKELVIN